MDCILIFISLISPAILGSTWLYLLNPKLHIASLFGFGYLIGILIISLILYFTVNKYFTWTTGYLLSTIYGLAFIPIIYCLIKQRCIPLAHILQVNTNPGWFTIIWWFLLILIAIRLSSLALEEFWRPLYPWDGWMNWAPKAKVWFELKEIIPFVSNEHWGDAGYYTLANSKATMYPNLIPLISLFMAISIGEWRDNWVNLPWLMCYMSLMLITYGQLRTVQTNKIISIAAVYIIASFPYINTHVALSGYADLWVSTFYMAAFSSTIMWVREKSKSMLALAVFMIIGCVVSKLPGAIWGGVFLYGVILGLFKQRVRAYILLFSVGLIIYIVIFGIDVKISTNMPIKITANHINIFNLKQFWPKYEPIGEYVIKFLFMYSSWSLIGYLFIAMLVVSRYMEIPESNGYDVGVVIILVSILFLVFIFFFTRYHGAAIDGTTINRALLHIAPATLYLLVIRMRGSEAK